MVTIDLDELRALAARVAQSADTLSRCGFSPTLKDLMRGSRIADVSTPALVANMFDDVIAAMRAWASAARSSADGFEHSEQRAVAHLAGS